MKKETMTIRKALSTKKMLDKQIQELVLFTNWTSVITKKERFIDGLSIDKWEKLNKANYQSLNDMFVRREAISVAVMKANATYTVKVPKFTGFKVTAKPTFEEIPLAAAIARKQYFGNILCTFVEDMERKVENSSKEYKKVLKDVDQKVTKMVADEFTGVQQNSSKQRTERMEELNKEYEVILLDPNSLGENIKEVRKFIEEYLNEIDSALGRATELIEIEVEY